MFFLGLRTGTLGANNSFKKILYMKDENTLINTHQLENIKELAIKPASFFFMLYM